MKAKELGKLRQQIHAKNTTTRFFRDKNEENRIGAAGEIAFAKQFNLEVDIKLYEYGDKNIDFVTKIGNIDVKTARIPKYLFVKEKDIEKCADILVLAKYLTDDKIEFIGWQTKEIMTKMPIKDFGYGIRNYFCPSQNLRPISELKELL